MIALAVAPLLIGVLLCGCAGGLARRLKPALAVPLLTALSLTVALCTGLVLSAAAVLVCAQLGPLSRFGHWSATAVRTGSGFPRSMGIVALLVVLACLMAAGTRAVRSLREMCIAGRAARLMRPVAGELVLVDDEVPTAYSVAGRRGRIVVSVSMLSALSCAERRVLMAHEAAHLRHRHHLYRHLACLVAAANPLLRPVADAVARAIERWADEQAAAEVGDRSLAARALARAALARAGHTTPRRALAAADGHVAERVQCLLAPPTSQKSFPVVMIVAAVLLSWGTAGAILLWANNVMQMAESVYSRR